MDESGHCELEIKNICGNVIYLTFYVDNYWILDYTVVVTILRGLRWL